MCVIIDADLAGLAFRFPPDPDFAPVINWITDKSKNGCLVFGGKLSTELKKVRNARHYLVLLSRAGRARQFPDDKVKVEENAIGRFCVANDPHVIALARLSGARTLCTHDNKLQIDFRNKKLINSPRGSIYKNATHKHLLRHTYSSCKIGKKRN